MTPRLVTVPPDVVSTVQKPLVRFAYKPVNTKPLSEDTKGVEKECALDSPVRVKAPCPPGKVTRADPQAPLGSEPPGLHSKYRDLGSGLRFNCQRFE